jgi:hypothetical protein
MNSMPDHDPVAERGIAITRTLSRAVPVCWKLLDHVSAAREWRALAEWVRWLATRYDLAPRTIPPCWYRHGSFVEELSALRTGWLAAFAADAPGGAPLDWHTMLWGTCDRLQHTVSRTGCTKDEHRDGQPARWLTAPDPGFAHMVDADMDERQRLLSPPSWS